MFGNTPHASHTHRSFEKTRSKGYNCDKHLMKEAARLQR